MGLNCEISKEYVSTTFPFVTTKVPEVELVKFILPFGYSNTFVKSSSLVLNVISLGYATKSLLQGLQETYFNVYAKAFAEAAKAICYLINSSYLHKINLWHIYIYTSDEGEVRVRYLPQKESTVQWSICFTKKNSKVQFPSYAQEKIFTIIFFEVHAPNKRLSGSSSVCDWKKKWETKKE